MSARNIAVLIELNKGEVAPISFELLGCARELAKSTGGEVIALMLGKNLDALCPALAAADRILAVEDPLLATFSPEPYLQVLENIVRNLYRRNFLQEPPRALLMGCTTIGLDIASLLAMRLDAPLITCAKSIQVDGDRLKVVCSLYNGKMLADAVVSGAPALIAILPGSCREQHKGGTAWIEKIASPIPLQPGAIAFEEMIWPEAGDIDITQQDILVAVGRGMKEEANLELAEELASVLGGVLCASRPIIDQGWLPSTRQVGKSGMTVKPKFYLALGISGAPEHIEGMKDSGLILAVNTDPNAPIFEVAHYGAAADVLELVPQLTEAIKNRG
ncbi:MAG: electron transfer flavoprotein subunit alpha/FixB family protein [Candidatus Omnitrophota bacterium]